MEPCQEKGLRRPCLLIVHPVHWQLHLVLARQGMRILGLIDEARLDEVASSIPAKEKGEAVFGSFESRGPLLFLSDEGYFHELALSSRLVVLRSLLL